MLKLGTGIPHGAGRQLHVSVIYSRADNTMQFSEDYELGLQTAHNSADHKAETAAPRGTS